MEYHTSGQAGPPASQPAPGRRITSKMVVLIILAIVVAIAVFATWMRLNSDKQYKYPYGKPISYKLPGSQPGRGMSYDVPQELSFVAPNENTQTRRGFEHLRPSDKNNPALIYSRLLVESNDYHKDPSANLIKLINDAMKAPESDSGYQGVVRNAQTFTLKAFQQPGVKYDYSHAKPFTNAYIKQNAWEFDTSVTGKDKKTFPPQQGELVFLIGKHTAYYFYISAIKSNWDSNHRLFDGVLNSIRIDQ